VLSMTAIVTKDDFEEFDADKVEGDRLSWRRYDANHPPLERLRKYPQNRLYLLTVRPPKFAVWLIAIYENVARRGGVWTSAIRNRTPIVDLTSIVADLRFESGNGLSVPARRRPQALQTPRVLTFWDLALIHRQIRKKGSAAPEDAGDLADLTRATEGASSWKRHLARERSGPLRAAARLYWRGRLGSLCCIACGFSFGTIYGPRGEDFIELHHVTPLAQGGKRWSRPNALVPVCSNCHRMIHREGGRPIGISALRKIVRVAPRPRGLANKALQQTIALPRFALAGPRR